MTRPQAHTHQGEGVAFPHRFIRRPSFDEIPLPVQRGGLSFDAEFDKGLRQEIVNTVIEHVLDDPMTVEGIARESAELTLNAVLNLLNIPGLGYQQDGELTIARIDETFREGEQ